MTRTVIEVEDDGRRPGDGDVWLDVWPDVRVEDEEARDERAWAKIDRLVSGLPVLTIGPPSTTETRPCSIKPPDAPAVRFGG